MNFCEWCSTTIHCDEDRKIFPDDLPDDLPPGNCSPEAYHRWCFEDVVHEYRTEIAYKHQGDR